MTGLIGMKFWVWKYLLATFDPQYKIQRLYLVNYMNWTNWWTITFFKREGSSLVNIGKFLENGMNYMGYWLLKIWHMILG